MKGSKLKKDKLKKIFSKKLLTILDENHCLSRLQVYVHFNWVKKMTRNLLKWSENDHSKLTTITWMIADEFGVLNSTKVYPILRILPEYYAQGSCTLLYDNTQRYYNPWPSTLFTWSDSLWVFFVWEI